MTSGIVYFNEIFANVKDRTDIPNLAAYKAKMRRSILNAENDIAAGGLIVRKEKIYTINTSEYDGTYVMLPDDVMGEYSDIPFYGVTYMQDRLKLDTVPGPDEVTLYYMGLLTDEFGDPITTRNHLEAVIQRVILDLFRPKVFLGIASKRTEQIMQQDYNVEVMAARGNDAFPSVTDFEEIGKVLQSPYGVTNISCGLLITDPFSTTTTTTTDCGSLTVDMIAIYEASKQIAKNDGIPG